MKKLFYTLTLITLLLNYPMAQGVVKSEYVYELTHGNTLSLTAVPEPGFKFLNWTYQETSDQFSINNPLTIAGINSDLNLYANFAKLSILIQVISIEPGGNPTGAGTYEYGDEITLSSNPWIGYEFVSWQVNGEVVSTEDPFVFPATESIDFTPVYQLKTYIIRIDVNPTDGGTIQDELKVNPNPTTGSINIEYPGMKMFEIMSMNGQIVERFRAVGDKERINIDHLTPGNYLVRVFNNYRSENRIIILV